MLINRKDFYDTLNRVRRNDDIVDKLYDLDINLIENELYRESQDIILRLLEILCFDRTNQWITYYICEMDWGKRWHPGAIKDNNGRDIKLETYDDLYNLLEYEAAQIKE